MRWLFELSGEHATLPPAEAIATFEALGSSPRDVEQDGSLLILTATAKPELVASRLAMTHFVNEELAAGGFESIITAAEKIDLAGACFMVRAPSGAGGRHRHSIEQKIGKVLARTGKVDLRNPEVAFRVIEGREWHLCKMLCQVERSELEKRRTARRPFAKPVSLHPRLARVLVNLARVPWGGTLLDPFCGTGGILIEAALAGAEVIGSDIDSAMVTGSQRTMKHFGQRARLIRADVGELPAIVGKVDAIATDPPYGRSSSTMKESLDSLYTRAFKAFGELLKPDCRVAVCMPDMKYADLAGKELKLEEEHAVRVHGSLTRHFLVFSSRP